MQVVRMRACTCCIWRVLSLLAAIQVLKAPPLTIAETIAVVEQAERRPAQSWVHARMLPEVENEGKLR